MTVGLGASIPAPWPAAAGDLERWLRMSLRSSGDVIVIMDDDPTGSQTVSDVPIVTSADLDDLRWGLIEADPTLFILTNTRAMGPRAAADTFRRIARSVTVMAKRVGRQVSIVSRGDSTLRGHFPLETHILAQLARRPSGHPAPLLLCPAYPEAGRVTLGGIHYVRTDHGMVPVADTDYAKDPTFGFRSSNLRDWVAERTRGEWPASQVAVLGLGELRAGGPQEVRRFIATLAPGAPCVVDAVEVDDVITIGAGIHELRAQGQPVDVRCGPTLARCLGGIPASSPLSPETLASFLDENTGRHGLVVVGSHVALSSRQVENALHLGGWTQLDLDVTTVLDDRLRAHAINELVANGAAALERGDVMICTDRILKRAPTVSGNVEIASKVASALVEALTSIITLGQPRWIVAKGGITSADTVTKVLRMRRAVVAGPLFPGMIPVWAPADGSGPICVVFPGNVGTDDSLAQTVSKLRQASSRKRDGR